MKKIISTLALVALFMGGTSAYADEAADIAAIQNAIAQRWEKVAADKAAATISANKAAAERAAIRERFTPLETGTYTVQPKCKAMTYYANSPEAATAPCVTSKNETQPVTVIVVDAGTIDGSALTKKMAKARKTTSRAQVRK